MLVREIDTVSPLEEIYLSGGEPLEFSGLTELIKSIRPYAQRVIIYSSGTRRYESEICSISEAQIKSLMEAGVYRFEFSLYSDNAKIHDTITSTPGSFQATVNSIIAIKHLGGRSGVHFVPMGVNTDSLVSTARLAQSLDCELFAVLMLTQQGRAMASFSGPDFDVSDGLFRQISELSALDLGIQVRLSEKLRDLVYNPEQYGRLNWKSIFIDSSGYLYPGEGQRGINNRSASTLLSGAKLVELIDELFVDKSP